MRSLFHCRLVYLLPGLLLFTACERSTPAGTAEARADAPNLLLITLDTTRVDRLGCYGYAPAQTPALDSLASSGVRFEQAFCQVPLTLPSHAALLTGTYPATNGLHFNASGVLPSDMPTLATALQGRGYRTGAFIAAWVLNSAFGLNHGFERYDDQVGEGTAAAQLQERSGDKVCDAALNWLNEPSDKPFFAWVHFYDPHHPYTPPSPYRERLAEPYDGEIAFMDAQIARLLEWLTAHNLRERTLVIAVGDHGEALGERGEIQHGLFLYDNTVHVPLLFSWPGRLPQGKVISGGVRLVDIMPTALDLLGLPPVMTVQGETLRPAFEAGTFAFRPVYSETEYPRIAYGWAALRSYTDEQWRYIEAPRAELYERAADPAEANNVHDAHADVATRMKGALEEALAGMPERTVASLALDDRATQALASLGYVGVGTPPPPSPTARDPKDMVEVARGMFVAQQLLAEKKYAEAAQVLALLAQESPESDEIFEHLGRAYAKLERFEEAARAYRSSLRAVPDSPTKLCELGDVLTHLGKLDEATECLQKSVAGSPNYAMAHNKLGVCYFQRRQFTKALEHFRRSVELDPTSATGLANLGAALVENGQKAEGAKYMQQALQRDPAHEATHRQLWQVLVSMQRFPEGITALRAACKALPDDLSLRRSLAGLLASTAQGNPAVAREALDIAQACQQREPNNPENYDVIGIAYAAAGDFPSAIGAARQALALAQSQNRTDLARQIAQRLQLYQSRG